MPINRNLRIGLSDLRCLYLLVFCTLFYQAFSQASVANFETKGAVCSSAEVQFQNTSFEFYADTPTYIWQFEGAEIEQVTQFAKQTAFAKWSTSGTKSLRLVMLMQNGDSVFIEKEIVVNKTPSPAFTWDNACKLTPVNFNQAEESTSNKLGFVWNFNDEQSDKKRNPSYLFSEIGVNTVTLHILDSATGCKDSLQKSLQILPQPDVSFAIDPNTSICAGDTIRVTNTSTNKDLQYVWDFGDGSPFDTAFSSEHSYIKSERTEINSITLSTEIAGGCKNEFTKYLTVNVLPDASFTWTIYGNAYQLKGPTGNSIYNWTFDDGGKATSQDVTYRPKDYPYFNVTACLATKNAECWNESCQSMSPMMGVEGVAIQSFAIYPNPAANHLKLKGAEDVERAIIYDIQGTEIKTISKAELINAGYNILIDELEAGFYYLVLWQESAKMQFTFIKQ